MKPEVTSAPSEVRCKKCNEHFIADMATVFYAGSRKSGTFCPHCHERLDDEGDKVASTDALVTMLEGANPRAVKDAIIAMAKERLKVHDETLRQLGEDAARLSISKSWKIVTGLKDKNLPVAHVEHYSPYDSPSDYARYKHGYPNRQFGWFAPKDGGRVMVVFTREITDQEANRAVVWFTQQEFGLTEKEEQ